MAMTAPCSPCQEEHAFHQPANVHIRDRQPIRHAVSAPFAAERLRVHVRIWVYAARPSQI